MTQSAALRSQLPGLTYTELREHKKEDLASACMDIAWMCAGRLSQSDILEKTTRPGELSTVMGTVIDKARLLKGESTVISETKMQNHRWAEEELQKLMRKFGWSREEAMEQIKRKGRRLGRGCLCDPMGQAGVTLQLGWPRC